LSRFCRRWGNDLPSWRYALLVGQAKRLALHPPDSAWGRRMLAKRGGLAAQRKCRFEGIDPLEKARAARLGKSSTPTPPQPKRRRWGQIYTLAPGVLPSRSLAKRA
jgi:hypothetical protein